MSIKINTEELKTLIAKEIREQNLNNALPEDAVEKIKDKILSIKSKETESQIPDVVSELDSSAEDAKFPDEREIIKSPEQQVNTTGETNSFRVNPGSTPTGQMSQPTMGYVPELPEILKKSEPAELFVFRYNDLYETGENLSYKPLRLMDDPDVKKSMNNLWIEEGKTKAKVYVAKFEEIGEINFNYTDGTSKFVEKASTPDYNGDAEYKDNPYAEQSLPQIDGSTQKSLETYIKNSINLEDVIKNVVMNALKDSISKNNENSMNEDIYDTETQENNGYSISQAVKPMEENIKNDLPTIEDIVKDDNYQKIILPESLNNSINKGDIKNLIKENEFLQEWEFEGERYFVPKNRISKDKGYKKI